MAQRIHHHHHHHHHHHYHHLSFNHKGHLGTTGDITTSFLHFSLFSTAFLDLANSRPFHFLMLSSHLFFFFLVVCLVFLPLSLCLAMQDFCFVFARPDEWETGPYRCRLFLFRMVRRSSCGPSAYWIWHKELLSFNYVQSKRKTDLKNKPQEWQITHGIYVSACSVQCV